MNFIKRKKHLVIQYNRLRIQEQRKKSKVTIYTHYDKTTLDRNNLKTYE